MKVANQLAIKAQIIRDYLAKWAQYGHKLFKNGTVRKRETYVGKMCKQTTLLLFNRKGATSQEMWVSPEKEKIKDFPPGDSQ